jgi:dynein heavy chain, axonemal
MIVGKTGAGKTAAWRTLQRAMAKLKESHGGDERYQRVHAHVINPLALSNDEIYGFFDPGTHEWQDGILARIMRVVCRDEALDQKWVTFDGPVDTLWIESMNTLLDDNKLLTLLSGERISMTPQARLWRLRTCDVCLLQQVDVVEYILLHFTCLPAAIP